jgi:hypothetical protein
MGIGSLFVLSLGLSVLVEVVRMLNGWERRESRQGGRQAEPCRLGRPSALWRLHADKRRQRCWGRGLSPAGQVLIFGSSRSIWVSRRAERRAEGAPSGLDYEIRKQVTRSCLTVCWLFASALGITSLTQRFDW